MWLLWLCSEARGPCSGPPKLPFICITPWWCSMMTVCLVSSQRMPESIRCFQAGTLSFTFRASKFCQRSTEWSPVYLDLFSIQRKKKKPEKLIWDISYCYRDMILITILFWNPKLGHMIWQWEELFTICLQSRRHKLLCAQSYLRNRMGAGEEDSHWSRSRRLLGEIKGWVEHWG